MTLFKAGLCALALLWGLPLRAEEPLPAPAGPVILTVSGAIGRTNAAGEARFDREMLETLGLTTVRTSTNWTDGVKVFEGVLLETVLRRVGASGSKVHAFALDDFQNTIPVSDLEYGVLLAMRMDGQPLTLRTKGPLWIVYPRDTYAALNDVRYDSRWVWQLKSLRVE